MDAEASENGNGVLMQDEPLQQIAATANRIVEELAKTDAFADMVRDYMDRGKPKVQFICPTQAELDSSLAKFKQKNSDLRIIFRETYADICIPFMLLVYQFSDRYASTVFVPCLHARSASYFLALAT